MKKEIDGKNMEHEHEKNNTNFWINKKAKIEIIKDNVKLTFTATILEIDSNSITFIERAGEIYNFSRDLIKEMSLLEGQK